MILVVSESAQEKVKLLERDAARHVSDFFAMLQTAQDQQELKKMFPGDISRLGGNFHWFVLLNEHCKIVMAFDYDVHHEPIVLILDVLDSRPRESTSLISHFLKASRWASDSLTSMPRATLQPQRQVPPADCQHTPDEQPAAIREMEEFASGNLTEMMRRASDEQRTAAREFQSRQNLRRNPLDKFFGHKTIEQPPETLNGPSLSIADRIARDFGNLGEQ